MLLSGNKPPVLEPEYQTAGRNVTDGQMAL